MAYGHRALTEQEAGPGVWKMVAPTAPPPMRGMVAQGMAPLPPRDLVVALYFLWVHEPSELGDQAAQTLSGLPPSVLDGALGDDGLAPGVLDFISRKFARREDVLERVVRHRNVDDETLAAVARACPEGLCEVLAENQRRWLQCPAIVESLYQNPNCPMSVAQRMIELAVRQGLDLKLPNLEEIKIAMGDGVPPVDPGQDEAFRRAMGEEVLEQHDRYVSGVERSGVDEEVNPDAIREGASEDEGLDIDQLLAAGPTEALSLPMEAQAPAEAEPAPDASLEPDPEPTPESSGVKGDRLSQITRLPVMHKIRLAMLGNAFERAVLIRDANKQVAMSAIKSTRVKENEVLGFASNRALPHEVVRYIATRKEWLKLYQVKLNLVLNPKTPLSSAMAFLNHLHPHDVRKVSRSRNIPSALAKAAKRKESQRR